MESFLEMSETAYWLQARGVKQKYDLYFYLTVNFEIISALFASGHGIMQMCVFFFLGGGGIGGRLK